MPESHESLPATSNDMERLVRVDRLVNDLFPDDVPFILEQLHDEDDIMGFLYGQLLEIGEDPDDVLAQYGITEPDS